MPQVGDDLVHALKMSLIRDDWFTHQQLDFILCDGLAWVGNHHYVSESQWLPVLQQTVTKTSVLVYPHEEKLRAIGC